MIGRSHFITSSPQLHQVFLQLFRNVGENVFYFVYNISYNVAMFISNFPIKLSIFILGTVQYLLKGRASGKQGRARTFFSRLKGRAFTFLCNN